MYGKAVGVALTVLEWLLLVLVVVTSLLVVLSLELESVEDWLVNVESVLVVWLLELLVLEDVESVSMELLVLDDVESVSMELLVLDDVESVPVELCDSVLDVVWLLEVVVIISDDSVLELVDVVLWEEVSEEVLLVVSDSLAVLDELVDVELPVMELELELDELPSGGPAE